MLFAVILVIDLVGGSISMLIMVLLPLYAETVPALFWIGGGFFGFFRASIYGTTFLWAERYITVNARYDVMRWAVACKEFKEGRELQIPISQKLRCF